MIFEEIKSLALGSYIAVRKFSDDIKIGKMESNGEHTYLLHQVGLGKLRRCYSNWENVTFYALEFSSQILEIHNWKFDGFNKYTSLNKQVEIVINNSEDECPFTVYLYNSDMKHIGHMDFTYFHELQSFCTICRVDLDFKFGIINYLFNTDKTVFKLCENL